VTVTPHLGGSKQFAAGQFTGNATARSPHPGSSKWFPAGTSASDHLQGHGSGSHMCCSCVVALLDELEDKMRNAKGLAVHFLLLNDNSSKTRYSSGTKLKATARSGDHTQGAADKEGQRIPRSWRQTWNRYSLMQKANCIRGPPAAALSFLKKCMF